MREFNFVQAESRQALTRFSNKIPQELRSNFLYVIITQCVITYNFKI